MKKEIRTVDEKTHTVRCTTMDERWYAKPIQDGKTGLPEFKALPSVTWIISLYPKLGLQKLRDELGADETDLLKRLGGQRGSKVHDAISAIIKGEEVRIDTKFINPTTNQPEDLNADEIDRILAFIDWKETFKPKFLLWDTNIYSEKYGYAGTLDAIVEIEGEVYLVDFKTSKVIGTDYEMQVSAYREAIMNGENEFANIDTKKEMKLAILQLGTKPLKTDPKLYRWKVVENRFDLFLAQRKIWEDVFETQIRDVRGFSQKDYPIVLSPALKVEEVVAQEPISVSEIDFGVAGVAESKTKTKK